MNYNEFKAIAKILKSTYTSERFLPDKDAMNVWFTMLEDLPIEVVKPTVQKYMLTEKFPPTIADIRGLAVEATDGKQADWGEGWQEVKRAISRYGCSRESEALDSLSPTTHECVKRLGWKMLCCSLTENEMADRANFRMIHNELSAREIEQAKLPDSLKEQINLVGKRVKEIETI